VSLETQEAAVSKRLQIFTQLSGKFSSTMQPFGSFVILCYQNWRNYPFKDEAQTALFKDPVRTAL